MARKARDFPRRRVTLSVSPEHWLATARNLRCATNLLFIAYETDIERFIEGHSLSAPIPDSSACDMLLGFAIENLLKGLYVTTFGDVHGIKSIEDLGLPCSRHDLHPFADALSQPPLSMKFTNAERDALSALEHVILWLGRYPSARTVDADIAFFEGDGFEKSLSSYPEGHFAALELYDRLESMLAAMVPPRAPNCFGVS